ncbi:TniQ family protein [Caballeronia sp. GAWG1-1]|uniref:TniQ family protein n=1 Tax=Caballeronia sp. GAWG1-1 TaxID=2921742 RepID=UPI0020291585|nr:TniQ family protein [Caballeronia sp. GAWG1-1]
MRSNDLRPWPVSPRPFADEAFGSWLGRVASRYQLSVAQIWEFHRLGEFPTLANTGWVLFPPLSEGALLSLSSFARLDPHRLARIQTPSKWMSDRPHLVYCFRCLVLNPVDIAAPRWKRIWLDTNIAACEVHGITLEQFPAAIARRARNMDRLLILVSKYRQKLQIA